MPSYFSIKGGASVAKEDIVEYQFTSEQSRTEAARNGAKGGKASGEARRRKRSLRDAVQSMLDLDLSDKEINDLAKKGYTAETQVDALAAAALISAKRGNSQAFANVMRLLGEGIENVSLSVSDDSTAAMDKFFENARTNFKSDRE